MRQAFFVIEHDLQGENLRKKSCKIAAQQIYFSRNWKGNWTLVGLRWVLEAFRFDGM